MDDQRRDIGRFHGAQLIGQGGFGSVYQATDSEHGRQVAIKVLHGALGERERRRFDRERQTMGRLSSHPNIMPVHESGYTPEGEGYIVMDLASGGSLGARVDRGDLLGWEEALAIAVKIAGAAQAAHDQGILHRDIKPDNILIDTYGNPRLTDFGIAWVASNATTTANTTATIAHAAPEVLEGQTSTEAVDIYAIASTFFHLVVGLSPFQRPNDEGIQAVIARALTQPPPDLTVHGVPAPVVRVIERALAKQPGLRQATAADLARELTEAAEEARRAPAGDLGVATVMAPAVPPFPGDATPATPSTGHGGDHAATVIPPLVGPGTSPPVDAEHAPTTISPAVDADHHPGAIPGYAPTVVSQAVHPVSPYQGAVVEPTDAYQVTPPGWNQPPGRGHGTVAPGRSGGGRGGSALFAVLVVALLAVAGVGAFILVPGLTGGAEGEGEGAAASSSVTDGAGEPGSTTSAAPAEASTTGADEAEPEPEPTTTAEATTTTADATVPVGGSEGVDCDVTRFAGYDERWLITICATAGGDLSYHAWDGKYTRGIDLAACQDEFGRYVAANQGTTYLVDPAASQLDVYDPNDDNILSEALLTEEVDFDEGVEQC